jgi:probable phosphoglycerate mutase
VPPAAGPDQEVVLVRHGQTEWSRTGRHTGRTDVPLTDLGRRLAAGVGPALTGWQFVKVLASPRIRALDTCRLAGFGEVAEEREDLVELDYGLYEGRTTPEIRADVPGWTVWTHDTPGGETLDQVATRVDRVIAEVRATPGHVALFSHGHLLRILTARWLGLPARDGRLWTLDPATVSVLGYERETPTLHRWNQPPATLS